VEPPASSTYARYGNSFSIVVMHATAGDDRASIQDAAHSPGRCAVGRKFQPILPAVDAQRGAARALEDRRLAPHAVSLQQLGCVVGTEAVPARIRPNQ
jgi:hypothetical protein